MTDPDPNIGDEVHYVINVYGDDEEVTLACYMAEVIELGQQVTISARPGSCSVERLNQQWTSRAVKLRVTDQRTDQHKVKNVVLFDPGTPETEYQASLVRKTILPDLEMICDGLRHDSNTWHWPSGVAESTNMFNSGARPGLDGPGEAATG